MKYEVEKYREELKALNETIWEAAELKFEEVRSMKAMAEGPWLFSGNGDGRHSHRIPGRIWKRQPGDRASGGV